MTKPDNTSSRKASLLPVLTNYVCRVKKHVGTLKQCDDVIRQTLQKMTILHCTYAKRVDASSVRKTIHLTLTSHFRFTPAGTKVVTCSQPKGRDNEGQRRTDCLIADVHVLFMVIVSSVNFGLLHKPCCAVTFYRLRRQSRVVRILPVLPLLLAVIALFFLIVIPGDFDVSFLSV